MTPIAIRPYVEDDFEAVTSLWFDSARSIGMPMPVSLDDLRVRWPKELDGGWIVTIATIESIVVGFVALKQDEICQLFVKSERQSEGIGKVLLDFCKSRLPDGFHLTTAVLGRASRFYEREGLKRGGISLHRFGHEIVRYDWRP